MNSGEKLKELCAKRGITAYELAKQLDISASSAYKLFARKTINPKTLMKLAAFFEIDFKLLISDDEDFDEKSRADFNAEINGDGNTMNIHSSLSEISVEKLKLEVTNLREKITQLENIITQKDMIILSKEQVIQTKDQLIELLISQNKS